MIEIKYDWNMDIKVVKDELIRHGIDFEKLNEQHFFKNLNSCFWDYMTFSTTNNLAVLVSTR